MSLSYTLDFVVLTWHSLMTLSLGSLMESGSRASPKTPPDVRPDKNINVIGSMLLPYFLCGSLRIQCLNL